MSKPQISIIDAGAVRDSRISHAEFRALASLGIYADKDGECFVSLRKIGEDLGGLKRQTIHGHVQRLIACGYVEIIENRKRENGSNSTCLYRLVPRQAEPNGSSGEPNAPSGSEPDAPSGSEPDAYKDPINDPLEKKVITLKTGLQKLPTFEEMFERWWKHVLKKVDKKTALTKFKIALKKTDFQTLLNGIIRYAESEKAKGTERNFIKGPAGWLHGERWLDEPEPIAPISKPGAAGDGYIAIVQEQNQGEGK